MTGQLVNAQQKIWACEFDCADKSVNFTDGTYYTSILIKKNSFVTFQAIKFNQDLSAYPPGILIEYGLAGNIWEGVITPFTSYPGQYKNTSGYGVQTELNPNNDFVYFTFTGMTGTGITALSMVLQVEVNECEV